MKPKKWNTVRIALFGAVIGAVVVFARNLGQSPDFAHTEDIAAWIGEIFGGAVGGAVLFALGSGLRNLFVRD